MTSTICSLFEKDFHYGLGSLINSLVASGFCGVFWAGYRGKLPPWAITERKSFFEEMRIQEKILVRFVNLETQIHFTHYKPVFFQRIFSEDPCDALFYFDPDIIVRAPWKYFETWVEHGICLCEDVNNYMPCNHPIKMFWKAFSKERGYTIQRETNAFYNGGFIGLKRNYKGFLELWEKLVFSVWSESELGNFYIPGKESRAEPFMIADQDCMNLSTILTDFPLTTVGPEGMDFIPGGYLMSHAIGSNKPWRKNFIISALRGIPPSKVDKAFFQNCLTPVELYPRSHIFWKTMEMKIASALGRVFRRT